MFKIKCAKDERKLWELNIRQWTTVWSFKTTLLCVEEHRQHQGNEWFPDSPYCTCSSCTFFRNCYSFSPTLLPSKREGTGLCWWKEKEEQHSSFTPTNAYNFNVVAGTWEHEWRFEMPEVRKMKREGTWKGKIHITAHNPLAMKKNDDQ